MFEKLKLIQIFEEKIIVLNILWIFSANTDIQVSKAFNPPSSRVDNSSFYHL